MCQDCIDSIEIILRKIDQLLDIFPDDKLIVDHYTKEREKYVEYLEGVKEEMSHPKKPDFPFPELKAIFMGKPDDKT